MDNNSLIQATYSGSDITVIATLPQIIGQSDSKSVTLGSLSTISYSSFREKFAVRSLGESFVRSYTRGARTIAGSMVFTMFYKFELDQLVQQVNIYEGETVALLDQLPPFDVILLFENEYGNKSIMRIYDVEFNTEGQVHSIDDLIVNKTLNFYAKDLVPPQSIKSTFGSYNDMIQSIVARGDIRDQAYSSGLTQAMGKTFDDIITDDPKMKALFNQGRNILI